MTGFIVQGHIKAFQFYKSLYFHMHFQLDILQKLHFADVIFSDRKTRKEVHLIWMYSYFRTNENVYELTNSLEAFLLGVGRPTTTL